MLLCSGGFCGSPAPPPSGARAGDGVLNSSGIMHIVAPPPPLTTPKSPSSPPPSDDADVILGRGNGCPTGYAKLTTAAACNAGVDQMRLPWWDTDVVKAENTPSWPAGCYSMAEGYCFNVPDCIEGVFFNRDPDGRANLDARPLCGKTFMPLAPPAPPPLLPSSALPWTVPLIVLLACVFCATAVCAYHRRRSKREYDLRRSRDRIQLDLQLLAHQLEQTVSEPALTAEPSPVDQPVAPTSSQPVAPTFSRLAPSRGGTSCSSYTEGTNSELGRTIIASSSETALTLSEVSGGAARLLLGRGRGRGGRPHHPYAASSVSSSKGTASTEANVHLLTTKEVDERYDLAFDLTAEITFAPVPQFGPPFLEVLSEAARAELLVSVGHDGRLMYANTGEPVVPRSGNSYSYVFVMLPSAGIYVRAKDPLVFHHHDLAGNAPVVAAGEIFFSDGRLLSINNRSGHYRPPPECLKIVLSLLQSKGAKTIVPFKEFHYAARGTRVARPDRGVRDFF